MTIYSDIRELIRSGSVTPDARISESSLAERLKVSRTPVREALARLDGDGLVVARGRGVRVRVLEPDQVRAVLGARAALESWAAAATASKVAAGEVAPARLRELTDLAEQTDALTQRGDIDSATAANRRFHLSLSALAGNTVVDETLARWWDQLLVATRAGLRVAARVDAVGAEHDRILRAVSDGNPEAAGRAVTDHIDGTTTSWEDAR